MEESVKEEEEVHTNAEQDKSSELFDFLYDIFASGDLEESMVLKTLMSFSRCLTLMLTSTSWLVKVWNICNLCMNTF